MKIHLKRQINFFFGGIKKNPRSRKQKLEKRKQKLGEKFTSDYSWRKFSSEQLVRLNPSIDFITIDTIYEIGWCNGNDKSLGRLKYLISIGDFSTISDLNDTIEMGNDEFGFTSIGRYIKVYIWTRKDQISFLQLIAGSFDNPSEKIICNQEILIADITQIKHRRLIYPI